MNAAHAANAANNQILGVTGVALLLVATIGIATYFLPLLLAILRKKPNVVAIGALNLFLGWTLIGWVASLVWALNNAQPQTVVVQNIMPPQSEQL